MSASNFIDIEGKRFLWRDVVRPRREQRRAAFVPEQPVLFELWGDHRPAGELTAAGSYLEPSLFTLLDREGPAA